MAVNLAQYAPWLVSQRELEQLREFGPRFSESNARLAHLLGDEFTEYRLRV